MRTLNDIQIADGRYAKARRAHVEYRAKRDAALEGAQRDALEWRDGNNIDPLEWDACQLDLALRRFISHSDVEFELYSHPQFAKLVRASYGHGSWRILWEGNEIDTDVEWEYPEEGKGNDVKYTLP